MLYPGCRIDTNYIIGGKYTYKNTMDGVGIDTIHRNIQMKSKEKFLEVCIFYIPAILSSQQCY